MRLPQRTDQQKLKKITTVICTTQTLLFCQGSSSERELCSPPHPQQIKTVGERNGSWCVGVLDLQSGDKRSISGVCAHQEETDQKMAKTTRAGGNALTLELQLHMHHASYCSIIAASTLVKLKSKEKRREAARKRPIQNCCVLAATANGHRVTTAPTKGS